MVLRKPLTIKMITAMYKLLLLILLIPHFCFSQSKVSSQFIDSLVNVSMNQFPQAGIAIAVIEDGALSHIKGYGISSAITGNKVDENTLFAIASNSKAFTTTALGILADQGKLSWDDKVIEYIPEFKMYDPYITKNFTIVDLLTHRSGLGLGAGDLMFFPDGSSFTIDDVLRSFQFQTPVSDFRTKYDYDNLLYVVAGEVIKRVSGKAWDKFVQDEIMGLLGMENSVGIYQNISNNSNVAFPHTSENQKIEQIDVFIKNDGSLGAAGGIYSNVRDMSKWVLMHLNEGLFGENLTDTLISKKNHRELWKIHTNRSYNAFGGGMYNTHYRGYGLGFNLRDEKGYTVVQHSGGLPGMLSMVTMIPELKAGIIVLTNASPGGLSLVTLTNEIKDEILEAEGINWLEWAESRLNESSTHADSVINAVWEQVKKNKGKTPELNFFTGVYEDNWFGEMEVYQQDNQLWIKSKKSPKLRGPMYYYNANTFAVDWEYSRDSGVDNYDAFAIFQLDETGKAISFRMKGISPIIDFSYDFQDLDFKRKGK